MPLDVLLPPARLALYPATEEIAGHFSAGFAVRVDLEGVTGSKRQGLAGARLPEPTEARLLDRVLQVVPRALLRPVRRIVVVDSGATGRFGGYLGGMVRLYSPVLRLTLADPQFGGRFSYFTTTVLHEIGHAIYAEELGDEQRRRVIDLYLAELIATVGRDVVEPSEADAEHYFVTLLTSALLGVRGGGVRPEQARESLRTLGLRLD